MNLEKFENELGRRADAATSSASGQRVKSKHPLIRSYENHCTDIVILFY
jgi:hypothetical protein